MRSATRTLPLAIAALSVLACPATGPEPESQSLLLPADTPVFWISIDTLRADRLPAYGYRPGRTPNLDALMLDSVRFERAYSHTPLTLPSHATALSGQLPAEHGIHDNLGFTPPEETSTLPVLLREAGYRTAAAVSSYALPGKSGLARGFDLYEDTFHWEPGTGLGEVQRPGSETLEALRTWLRRETESEAPLFALFHLYEPHSPYRPPQDLAAEFPHPYDGEVAAADRILGAFFDELEELGLYDRALIVLFSDHGEGLGDHGEAEHGLLLYPETLHVPLVIKLPNRHLAGTTRVDPAGLVDLLPTTLGLLGIDTPPQATGRALFDPPSDRARPLIAETLYPRYHFGWSELVSVVDGDLLYVHGPDPELYDLAEDPGAKHNLVDSRRRDVHRLRTLAADYPRARHAFEPAEIEAEDAAALAALGYVGGWVAAEGTDSTRPLADPKAQVDTLGDLTTGFQQFQDGDYAAAAVTLGRAVATNPRLVHAWEYLARSLHNAGDLEPALVAYRRAIDHYARGRGQASPANAAPAAMIFLDLGRAEDAVALLADQRARDPQDRRLRDLEIRALLTNHDFDLGRQRAQELSDQYPEDPAAIYQLAVALAMSGETDLAIRALVQVLELDPDHRAAKTDLAHLSRSR